MERPDPFPNSEVKHLSADNSWFARFRENRSRPGIPKQNFIPMISGFFVQSSAQRKEIYPLCKFPRCWNVISSRDGILRFADNSWFARFRENRSSPGNSGAVLFYRYQRKHFGHTPIKLNWWMGGIDDNFFHRCLKCLADLLNMLLPIFYFSSLVFSFRN